MKNTTKLLALCLVLVGLGLGTLVIFADTPKGMVGEETVAQEKASALVAQDLQKVEFPEVETEGETNSPREQLTFESATGTLRVTVLWASGEPAPGIALSIRAETRGLPYTNLTRSISDAQGMVRIDGLPAITLGVRSERGGMMQVEVVAGQQTKCDFNLPEGIEFRGVVTDRQDKPVLADIWLQTESLAWSGGRVVGSTDADGTFALQDIPAGLSLGALAAGYAPSALLDLDKVDTSTPPVDVRLVLENGAGGVEGRVVSHAGIPIAGALVAVGVQPRSLKHDMGPAGPDRWTEKWTPRTTTCDEDGRFLVTGIKTGTLSMAARAEGFGLWRTEVKVIEGERTWVDITLGEVVSVTGTVTDQWGDPVAGASVRAYDKKPGLTFIQGGQIDFYQTFGHVGAMSDVDGRYQLMGATPGDLQMYAQPKIEGHMGQSVPFASDVLKAGPGDDIEWNPVISPGRTIEGVVLFEDGYPMGGIFISATDEQGGPRLTMFNGKHGRFRFVCLEAASYSLHVQYPFDTPRDKPPLDRNGVVPGQGSLELRAPFPKPIKGPKGAVTGRIDDIAGRVPHAKALKVLLVNSTNGWRTRAEIKEGVFRFDDVEVGRYRVVAMAGDNAIAQRDWFEVQAAEEHDIGVLLTDRPGSVIIKLARGAGAAELEPTIYLRKEGWSRGSQVAMGRRSEVRLNNLSAGTYEVTSYSAGMVRLKGSVEVRVGEESELHLTLRPAALVRFGIWFPEGHAACKATVTIVDARGEALSEFNRKHGGVSARPDEFSSNLPPGEWEILVTTDTGLSGETHFSVDSLDGESRVKVDVK